MIPFTKMHGLGNDFVIIDLREDGEIPDADAARAIADRHHGIGCDQIVLIGNAANRSADVRMQFLNADGSESGACGNGTRCAAALLRSPAGQKKLVIETIGGLLEAEFGDNGSITVDMGPPQLDWRDVPLARDVDTLNLDIALGPLRDPVAVGMGNPHCIFFVDDAEDVDLEALGPQVEHHPLFPARTNVEVATIVDEERIRLRVWERGVGITLACGSGACATLVAAHRRELTGRKADLMVDGGTLSVTWRDDGHVLLTGPVATSFTGLFSPGRAA